MASGEMEEGSAAAGTVLIVAGNSDSALRGSLESVLREAGFRAASVQGAMEALDYLRREEAPCLVLLLMRAHEFREEQKKDPELESIPVLVLAAHRDSGSESSSLE